MKTIVSHQIAELQALKKEYQISCRGNIELLKRKKVSIVGSRNPNPYTREATFTLAKALANRGVCVVSGGAIGVDAIAHEGAGYENTICVLGSGINVYYPKINKNMIANIAHKGLLLSQFEPDFKATNWSFLLRNEIVVSLGEIVVVTQADIKSGSMYSLEFAKKAGKQIYVLPHRIGESDGTNMLVAKGEAKIIDDIGNFVAMFGKSFDDTSKKDDPFYLFCQTNPTLDEVVAKFNERVYEAELSGEVVIKNGRVSLT